MTVKLIAADMDGTLLDSNKKLSPYLFDLVKKLKEKEIKFAIASGRQYFNLLENFEDIKGDLVYISDNGSIVYDNGQSIYVDEINTQEVKKALKDVRQGEGMYPILCGVESAYVENDNEVFLENARMYYAKLEIVEDLMDVLDKDKICKLAVFDEVDAENNAFKLLEKYNKNLMVCLSGHNWVDLMNPGVNKGEAIKILQENYNISYDETMAFGDYLNDYEMMQSCKYSYAMDNAHPKLKEICNYRAKSNDDDGVVHAIKEYFEL
ncbi:HAD family hydrolase [Terrisporobacter petrolearius]|uniref:HAD family hydrolase n=1 Tax=Terrisporobacter petrolearius TaxID=1460447 RepID=UPI001D16CC5D|nr:HAD family hydrolase [Terrisporobacter petrolearius]MCC3863784.1 HAD family hydrolase [Terrisporobacter petrolearius]